MNGQPACANRFLLQKTLRGAWHFHGDVVSDCDAVRDIFTGHHYRPTQTEASAIAVGRVGQSNQHGRRAGEELGQVYLEFPPVPGAPLRALRGFAHIHPAPGQSRRVRFTLTRRALSLVTGHGSLRPMKARVRKSAQKVPSAMPKRVSEG